MFKKIFTNVYSAALTALVVLVAVVFSFTKVSGKEFQISQRFKPGDVISADVFNDLFDYLSRTLSPPTTAEILGPWQCTKYMLFSNNYATMFQHYTTPDGAGLWRALQLNITFSDNGDGTYSWDSGPTYNAFEFGSITNDTCAGHGSISLFNGRFAVTSTQCGAGGGQATRGYEIRRLSTSRMEINQMGGDGINSLLFVCDKQNIPPAAPNDLTASVTGNVVALLWADNSSTESGFKVFRKDSLAGSFNVVASLPANTTNYEDSVPQAGSYWYWIKATNDYGDSDGSNVVNVDIQ